MESYSQDDFPQNKHQPNHCFGSPRIHLEKREYANERGSIQSLDNGAPSLNILSDEVDIQFVASSVSGYDRYFSHYASAEPLDEENAIVSKSLWMAPSRVQEYWRRIEAINLEGAEKIDQISFRKSNSEPYTQNRILEKVLILKVNVFMF